ncbi:MAG: thiamine transport system ATP-binding protein [Thermoproteota archaeon]|nr:thiamine transport system ATP-binding protein [Thermoproteota archaeon]
MSELRVENLSKSYGKMKALDKVNLTVKPSEFLVVMGPSGCGKTTLLLTVLGVLKPDEGRMYIDGKDIDSLRISERNIGYAPQDFGLFPHLSTHDNVAFGLRAKARGKSEVEACVAEMLSLVGLEGLEQRKPSELSGGQKQRVALARALAINPYLLLLDEPLSNIDEITKAEVKVNLKETVKRTGVTTVCVMHDAEDALELGDRIAVMHAGRVIQCATPTDLLKNPEGELVRELLHHLVKIQ